MKKYHIADLLTLTRFLCGVALFGFVIFTKIVALEDWIRWTIFWLFIFGELTDAFDGIAARRWPYPDDHKQRWWRTYAVQLDQFADILLLAAIGSYVVFCIEPFAAILVAISVACAVPIQIWRASRIKRFGPDESKDPLRVKVVLARRFGYLFLIVYAIIQMIFALPTSSTVHLAFLVIGAAIGIALIIIKSNRLTEDKTT